MVEAVRQRSAARFLRCTLAPGLLTLQAAAGQCTPSWNTQFPTCPFDSVTAMLQFDADGPGLIPSMLFVGGQHELQGAPPNDVIMTWDGSAWNPLGLKGSPYADVAAMAIYDEDGPGGNPPVLFAAGSFSFPGQPANIARWNGAQWTPVGAGLNTYATALTVWDPDGSGPIQPVLVVAGSWYVKTWDGQTWTDISNSTTAVPLSLASFDPDGDGPELPQLVRGVPAGPNQPLVERWSGTAWVPLGTFVNTSFFDARINALLAIDPDDAGPQTPVLYAGGRINWSGPPPYRGVIRWDGSQWSAMGSNLADFDEVRALAWFDPDGPGPAQGAVCATCNSNTGVVHFDGALWISVGGGIVGHGVALTIADEALYVGGDMTAAGGQTAHAFARWGCSACYANCDHSTLPPVLNANDFQCFLNTFAAGYSSANCDHSTAIPLLNANDFQCFLNSFAAGCP